MAKLEIQKVVCGAYEANSWLVWRDDRDDCLLIDCGDDPMRCLEAVKKSGKRLTDIALTHGHFDHVIGAYHVKSLTGAKIAIHSADVNMLSNGELALATSEFGLDRFVPCAPDTLLDQLPGGIYAAAGIPLRVLHTPGHTPGSVCLYLPEQNLLFSGDTIFSYGFGRTDFPGGSMDQLKTSLQMLFKLPGETMILCGHGDTGAMKTYHAQLRRSE